MHFSFLVNESSTTAKEAIFVPRSIVWLIVHFNNERDHIGASVPWQNVQKFVFFPLNSL